MKNFAVKTLVETFSFNITELFGATVHVITLFNTTCLRDKMHNKYCANIKVKRIARKLSSKILHLFLGLNFHMLSHKNTHECTICKKQFSLEIMLKNHMASHNGSGSAYACTEDGCDAVSVTQEQLSRHSQTAHTGVKADKSTAYDEDTEIETEDEEMDTTNAPASFTCAKCNTSFSEFDHLKVHLEKHEEMDGNNGEEGTETGPDGARDGTASYSDTTIPSFNTTNTNEGTSIQIGQS